jgi:hypothetical protein
MRSSKKRHRSDWAAQHRLAQRSCHVAPAG